jgi:type VI secretion system secreted protein VgrG
MPAPDYLFETSTYSSNFEVVSFKGNERISRLFRYVIGLKVPCVDGNDLPDFEEEIMQDDIIFSMSHNGEIKKIHGVLSSFENVDYSPTHAYYQAVLVPNLWNGSLGVSNQIHKNKTIPAIIVDELIALGLNDGVDFVDSTTNNYPKKQFVCQYNESNFDFISRLMEYAGIYYYFDHHQTVSKLVFTDDDQYPSLMNNEVLFERNPNGDKVWVSVSKFKQTLNRTTESVLVRDYNSDQASLSVEGEFGSIASSGVLNLLDENVEDPYEAETIAKIRLEEIHTKKQVYDGESGVIHLNPGYTFELKGHRNNKLNNNYLIVGVIHEGLNIDQAVSSDAATSPAYTNTFRVIKSNVQFRPRQVTPRPKIYGTKSGTIYAEQFEPERAEIDIQGRYRVKLHYINSIQKDEVSHWIPMAQPAAGPDTGIFVPLRANVQVLLTFIDGNPDKPIIQSALPNSEFPSAVTSNNPNHALIGTSGLLALKAHGGWYREIAVEGKVRAQSQDTDFNIIDLSAGVNKTVVGAVMDEAEEQSGNYIINRLYGDQYTWVDGSNFEWDNKPSYAFGNSYDEIHENEDISCLSSEVFVVPYMPNSKVDGEDGLVEKIWGDKFEFHQGSVYNWSGGPGPGGSNSTFAYGNGYTENLIGVTDGGSSDPEQAGQKGTFVNITNIKDSRHELWRDYEKPSPAYKSEPNNGDNTYTYDELLTDHIDPGRCVFEKTWGATYSYHNGFSLDVKEGNSVSKTWGDSNDVIDGNQRVEIKKDQYESVTGNSESHVYGANQDFYYGANTSLFAGNVASLHIGGKEDVFFGVAMELSLSATLKVGVAGEFERKGFKIVSCGSDIRANAALITANATNIKNVATDVSNCATTINNNANNLTNSAVMINLAGLTVLT